MSEFYTVGEKSNALFYQMPKWLYELEPYKSVLKSNHRETYMLLKDRLSYSIDNKWTDNEGRLYLIYTNEELASMLGCSEKTVTNIKSKLIEVGLLIVKKQGFNWKEKQNNPSHLYLLKPVLSAVNVYNSSSKKLSQDVNFSSREENNAVSSNIDISEKTNINPTLKDAQSLGSAGKEKTTVNKYNNSLDTKKIHKDTQLDFSPSSFTQAEIEAQNKDLVKHASQFMTESDDSENFILSKPATKLLSLWCKTPKQLYRVVQIILNAKNSVKKEFTKLNLWQKWQVNVALELPGQYRDDEQVLGTEEYEYTDQFNQGIENTLRKVLNSIRRNYDYGKPIKSVENYMFISFKRYFEKVAMNKLEGLVTNLDGSQKLLSWYKQKNLKINQFPID